MKIEKHIRRNLSLYYLDNEDLIEDFIATQLVRVYDIVATGVNINDANDQVISELGNMEELKKELKKNTKNKSLSAFTIIFSFMGAVIVDFMTFFLFRALSLPFDYAYIIMVGVIFWPLSQTLRYFNNKREA